MPERPLQPVAHPRLISRTLVEKSSLDHSIERYRLCDLLAVEAAVLNEDFVGMHPGHDHARQEDSWAVAFERVRIDARTLGHRLQADPEFRHEVEVRMISDQREHKIVLERHNALRRF